jgi:hypothetical protein
MHRRCVHRSQVIGSVLVHLITRRLRTASRSNGCYFLLPSITPRRVPAVVLQHGDKVDRERADRPVLFASQHCFLPLVHAETAFPLTKLLLLGLVQKVGRGNETLPINVVGFDELAEERSTLRAIILKRLVEAILLATRQVAHCQR